MYVKAFLFLAVKMDESSHGMKQSPRNGKPQPKSPHIAAAAGIGLVKVFQHLRNLGGIHAYAGVIHINNQVDPITLPAESDADVNTAFLRKLKRIIHQNFKHMGHFFRIPNQNRWYSGIYVKHCLQMITAVLQCCHGNHVIENRSDHIGFLCRGQGPFHDLRIIQYIIDLSRKTLARQLYGLHIGPDFRWHILPHGLLADSDNHIDGGTEFVGYI